MTAMLPVSTVFVEITSGSGRGAPDIAASGYSTNEAPPIVTVSFTDVGSTHSPSWGWSGITSMTPVSPHSSGCGYDTSQIPDRRV